MVASRPRPAAITIRRLRSAVIGISLVLVSQPIALAESHARDDHESDVVERVRGSDLSARPHTQGRARSRGLVLPLEELGSAPRLDRRGAAEAGRDVDPRRLLSHGEPPGPGGGGGPPW